MRTDPVMAMFPSGQSRWGKRMLYTLFLWRLSLFSSAQADTVMNTQMRIMSKVERKTWNGLFRGQNMLPFSWNIFIFGDKIYSPTVDWSWFSCFCWALPGWGCFPRCLGFQQRSKEHPQSRSGPSRTVYRTVQSFEIIIQHLFKHISLGILLFGVKWCGANIKKVTIENFSTGDS